MNEYNNKYHYFHIHKRFKNLQFYFNKPYLNIPIDHIPFENKPPIPSLLLFFTSPIYAYPSIYPI